MQVTEGAIPKPIENFFRGNKSAHLKYGANPISRPNFDFNVSKISKLDFRAHVFGNMFAHFRFL